MTVAIKDLTGGEVKGAGLFDELMRTSKDHLTEEYDAGRITGVDYSNVYLGVLQSNLQTASSFLLQYELTNQQLLLAQEQITQLQKQNELLELQKAQITIANSAAQYNLDNMMPEQLAQIQEQVKLTTQQTGTAAQQELLLAAQTTQAGNQATLLTKQEELVDEQVLDAKDKAKAIPLYPLTVASIAKVEAEESLLSARKDTEDAQTIGTKDTTGGLLGSQMNLLYTQKEGFLRDAEQKAAKIQSDAFAIAHSITPESHVPSTYGFGASNSTLVIDKLNAGIGVNT